MSVYVRGGLGRHQPVRRTKPGRAPDRSRTRADGVRVLSRVGPGGFRAVAQQARRLSRRLRHGVSVKTLFCRVLWVLEYGFLTYVGMAEDLQSRTKTEMLGD